jgi:hypothetical protein
MLLSEADVERFLRDGYFRLENAFPRGLAERCRTWLWRELKLDPDDPAAWTQPVIRLMGSNAEPFRQAANTASLHAAFDQLVGPQRWIPRPGIGTFPIRFPSELDPGDAGWHVDGSYACGATYYLNVRSRDRALLMLFLFSDVAERDAPTRIRVGSHLAVPPILAPAGDEGLPFDAIFPRLPPAPHAPVAPATGSAGDVYLCHPFLVHAASWPHRGSTPRFMAQPPLALVAPFALDASGPHYPVERAILMGLAREPDRHD